MKKYKLIASNENKIEDNKIEFIPDIISSDIPYFIEIDEDKMDHFKIINAFLSKEEKAHNVKTNNFEFSIGNKSGKVYEMYVDKNIPIKRLRKLIKDFLKNSIEIDVEKDSRYYNNVKFSTDLLKEIYTEVE